MEDLLNARIKPANKKGRLSYLLKYQLIYRISIILYRYIYRIEKVDPDLSCTLQRPHFLSYNHEIGQNVCLAEISDEYKNGSCRVKK